MIQNGSSNTIRKMNQVLLMKNAASSRLRDVLIASGGANIKSDFETAVLSENEWVLDWKEKWYQSWVTSLQKPREAIKIEPDPGGVPPAGGGLVGARAAIPVFSTEFHSVYADLSPATSTSGNVASFPWG